MFHDAVMCCMSKGVHDWQTLAMASVDWISTVSDREDILIVVSKARDVAVARYQAMSFQKARGEKVLEEIKLFDSKKSSSEGI